VTAPPDHATPRPGGGGDHPTGAPADSPIALVAALGALGLGALGLGAFAAVGAAAAAPAAADAPSDVSVAETAAALEHTAIAVYARVAALPFVQSVPPPGGVTLANFLGRTAQQHADHLSAFNAAAVRLGGKAQTGVDTILMNALEPALAKLASAQDAVAFAAMLEQVAAETFAAPVAVVADRQLRSSLASIAGVECQHESVLLAVAALLGDNRPELISFPIDPLSLPAVLPSEGLPSAFLKTDRARPPAEGTVR
jgi:rubrerythrin